MFMARGDNETDYACLRSNRGAFRQATSPVILETVEWPDHGNEACFATIASKVMKRHWANASADTQIYQGCHDGRECYRQSKRCDFTTRPRIGPFEHARPGCDRPRP